jgi:hypothetical protein
VQPLVLVRGANSTVEPTPTGLAAPLVLLDALLVALPSSQAATPPWWEQVPE